LLNKYGEIARWIPAFAGMAGCEIILLSDYLESLEGGQFNKLSYVYEEKHG
jgi:hypothetical protein